MSDEIPRYYPMIVLLLKAVRRVSADEIRRVVQAELGNQTAAGIESMGQKQDVMQYHFWRHDRAFCNFGTCCEPYPNTIYEGEVDSDTKLITPTKSQYREEVPPQDEVMCQAWMQHNSWIYVDALLFHTPPEDDHIHYRRVFKIASHFIDERCVLIWLYGGEPKRVALPTPQAIASLRAGEWPG